MDERDRPDGPGSPGGEHQNRPVQGKVPAVPTGAVFKRYSNAGEAGQPDEPEGGAAA